MHDRQKIREAARDALLDETLAGDQVHIAKFTPYERDSFPAISIYTPSEDSTYTNEAPPILRRTCQLTIELVDKLGSSGEDLNNTLDSLAEEVEDIIFSHSALNNLEGVRPDSALLKSSNFSVDSKGENLLGVLALEFEVVYYTSLGVREVDADPLTTLNVDQENYPYEDTIEFDQ